MAQQLLPNAQLLIAEDGNGCTIKSGQWHTTACICTSLPPQHTYARMVRLVFGSLHHVLSIKCKYRRFGGPVLWIQHHEILLVLCMSSSFHKLESAMIYTSRSAITVGVQHIWRQSILCYSRGLTTPFVVWKQPFEMQFVAITLLSGIAPPYLTTDNLFCWLLEVAIFFGHQFSLKFYSREDEGN